MALRHPLFVSGASAGVTSPQDARLALAGLLSGPGLLNGYGVSGSTSGPNMKYLVAAGVAATARGVVANDGLYLVSNDGVVTVDSGAPAPASGTRWDLVWVRCLNAFDGGFGDANSDPVFGVTVGTAGSSPTKPYASVPAGALVLAESNVGTNIANASLATISNVAAGTTVGADTGWVNLTGLGGSYTTPATVGAGQAQFRVLNGLVYMQGIIQTLSGNPFPANTTVLLIASGNLPPQIVPVMSINRALAATNPAAFARGIITTGAGTMSIATSAAPGSYVDIGGFSGYEAA